MKNPQLKNLANIIEAILFVSGKQVAVKDIAEKLEVDETDVNKAAEILREKYSVDSGIQLLSFNKKFQLSTNSEYAQSISSVLNPIKEKELSRSMMEAAAIIAYKQPVTRLDLEEIRGVNSEYAVQKLMELNLIEVVGRKDSVGKPVLFGTTDEFLKRFCLSSLEDLPDYDQLMDKIKLIHEDNDAYLYKKDVYIEEVAATVAEQDLQFDDEIPDFIKDEENLVKI